MLVWYYKVESSPTIQLRLFQSTSVREAIYHTENIKLSGHILIFCLFAEHEAAYSKEVINAKPALNEYSHRPIFCSVLN